MRVGIVATSLKPNEKRVPIHPDHLPEIPEHLRRQMIFEQGYGARFGREDREIERLVGGIAPREELMGAMDAVILLKPMARDFELLPEGGMLWGWPHCLQQVANTQAAIDRRLTVLAFECMFEWGPDGSQGMHPFYRNNEMGGYCGVIHALGLKGYDAHYGKSRKVLILGYGAVATGAIRALQGRGFDDITVLRTSPVQTPKPELPGCTYYYTRRPESGPGLTVLGPQAQETPLIELLAESDIIISALFQDPNRPLMLIDEAQQARLKPGAYLLDLSCDEGMGYPFSRPTSFDAPLLRFGAQDYYSVDHTPNYLWEAASWEFSQAVLPYLERLFEGPAGWQRHEILRRAVEIDKGVVVNPAILAFQRRQAAYPHLPLA